MNSSTQQTSRVTGTIGAISTTGTRRFATALAVLALACGFSSTAAYADNGHGHGHGGGHYQQHGGHFDHRDYGHRDYGHHGYYRGGHYYYGYAQPIYAPAPVYVAPPPSPGVSLFFPIVIH